MSFDWVSGAISAIKLPPKLVASIALPSGLLVLLPDAAIERLGLTSFLVAARPYVSLVFLVSLSILAIGLAVHGYKRFSMWMRYRRQRNKILDFLKTLDQEEVRILRKFQDRNSVNLSILNPTVAGLELKTVIQRIGIIGTEYEFLYRLHPAVREILTSVSLRHPALPTDGKNSF